MAMLDGNGIATRVQLIEQRLGIDIERYKDARHNELTEIIRGLKNRLERLEATIEGRQTLNEAPSSNAIAEASRRDR